MATYVNDLRLKEITTGDESGTWGTSTNTNLELIAEAFSFGTEAITTNADTHTTTVADGATDPGRSLYLKYTGTLDSACTITLGPDSVSKVWIIENATSGSQDITIKQGSGTTVTIPNGNVKVVYSDGAGSGGSIVDALTDLNLSGTTNMGGNIDMNGNELILDGDADTSITADTDDQIDFKVGGTDQVKLTDGALSPVTDSDVDLGTTSLAYKNAYIDSLGLGTNASGTVGEIRASNNITAYYSSDIGLKENLNPIKNSIEKIQAISGYNFDWKDEVVKERGGEDDYFVRKSDVGVVAQEIEAILPEACATRPDGTKAVRYEQLVPLLIEGIKELKAEIEELKK
jgi:hypothetical protein